MQAWFGFVVFVWFCQTFQFLVYGRSYLHGAQALIQPCAILLFMNETSGLQCVFFFFNWLFHQLYYQVSFFLLFFFFSCSLVQPCWHFICCDDVFYQCYSPFATSLFLDDDLLLMLLVWSFLIVLVMSDFYFIFFNFGGQ